MVFKSETLVFDDISSWFLIGDNAWWSWVDFQHITVSRMESQRWLFSDADSTFLYGRRRWWWPTPDWWPACERRVISGRNFDGGSESIGLLTKVDHWVCAFYGKRGLLEPDSAFALICFIGVQWRVDLGILPSSPSASIDDLRLVTANSPRSYASLRKQLLVDPHLPKDGCSSPDLVMDNPLSQDPVETYVFESILETVLVFQKALEKEGVEAVNKLARKTQGLFRTRNQSQSLIQHHVQHPLQISACQT